MLKYLFKVKVKKLSDLFPVVEIFCFSCTFLFKSCLILFPVVSEKCFNLLKFRLFLYFLMKELRAILRAQCKSAKDCVFNLYEGKYFFHFLNLNLLFVAKLSLI